MNVSWWTVIIVGCRFDTFAFCRELSIFRTPLNIKMPSHYFLFRIHSLAIVCKIHYECNATRNKIVDEWVSNCDWFHRPYFDGFSLFSFILYTNSFSDSVFNVFVDRRRRWFSFWLSGIEKRSFSENNWNANGALFGLTVFRSSIEKSHWTTNDFQSKMSAWVYVCKTHNWCRVTWLIWVNTMIMSASALNWTTLLILTFHNRIGNTIFNLLSTAIVATSRSKKE